MVLFAICLKLTENKITLSIFEGKLKSKCVSSASDPWCRMKMVAVSYENLLTADQFEKCFSKVLLCSKLCG